MAHSELASPGATRRMLESFGLDAKHALGQNFLIDDNVVGSIVHMAGLNAVEGELPTLLEIGPGIGTLTIALLAHARVIAVERDRDLVGVLAETTARDSDRFALLQDDALKVTRADIEQACAMMHAPLPHQLVANLPYGVAATVILDWFERFDFLDAMTVMVQSEVADRIMASPGTKSYGAYTVKLRLHAHADDRFQVSAHCFYPAPRVESAVIHLQRASLDVPAAQVTAACEVADAAFAQRRKTVRNSLKGSFDTPLVDALLDACGIAPSVRGETLAPETYLALGRALLELR